MAPVQVAHCIRRKCWTCGDTRTDTARGMDQPVQDECRDPPQCPRRRVPFIVKSAVPHRILRTPRRGFHHHMTVRTAHFVPIGSTCRRNSLAVLASRRPVTECESWWLPCPRVVGIPQIATTRPRDHPVLLRIAREPDLGCGGIQHCCDVFPPSAEDQSGYRLPIHIQQFHPFMSAGSDVVDRPDDPWVSLQRPPSPPPNPYQPATEDNPYRKDHGRQIRQEAECRTSTFGRRPILQTDEHQAEGQTCQTNQEQ